MAIHDSAVVIMVLVIAVTTAVIIITDSFVIMMNTTKMICIVHAAMAPLICILTGLSLLVLFAGEEGQMLTTVSPI